MKVIGIAGEMETGKSTFAIPLVQRGWIECSFAYNLKEMCKNIFNLSDYYVNHPEGKRKVLAYPRYITPKILANIVGWMENTHDLSDKIPEITAIRTEITNTFNVSGYYPQFTSSRALLQYVGTDICRRILEEYHLDVLHIQLAQHQGNCVITDVRFPNERHMLKDDFAATLVRLKRPGYTPDHLLDQTTPKDILRTDHASENSLGEDTEYDVVIINNGNIQELQERSLMFL
jgi:hypothetical protein